MGIFSFLATEAAAALEEHSGFGLNLNILETNLINLAILIGVLFYFGRKALGNVLSERRSKIEQEIREAEKRQKDAAAALADAQQKLAKAQAEAEQIRATAEENSKLAREAILSKAVRDVERLNETAAKDLDTARERAIAELRERVAMLAIERVESQLKDRLDGSAQQQLIDRSIALLGGGS
jgi:F-type H+-transporting ATPase subunit b